jgi:hypothetical protein
MKKVFMGILVLILAGAVLPTTLLLCVGMMPTVAAYLIDKTKQRLKAMTVGCLNFAACFPYWLDLLSTNHTIDKAWEIITPMSMSIMYSGAIAGYVVEWGVSLVVAVLMVQQAKAKLRSIKRQKERMVDRWGVEVTGQYRLDEQGFMLPKTDNE